MTRQKKLLEDTFEHEDVQWLVCVEEKDMLIDPKKESVYKNCPAYRSGRHRTVCRCRVALLRPDYGRTSGELPENVDTLFKAVEPLEWPKKKMGLIFTSYEPVRREPERDAQELAEQAIGKMKMAYENRQTVQSLDG